MSILGIDHVMLGVSSLPDTVRRLHDLLGLSARPATRPWAPGMVDAVIGLEESFIDVIAVEDEEAARQAPHAGGVFHMVRSGGGFMGYGFATDDLDGVVAAARSRGTRLGDPVEGTREAQSGAAVTFRISRFENAPVGGAWPVFVERGSGAEEPPPAVGHPIGATALRRLGVTGYPEEYEELRTAYEAVLGPAPTSAPNSLMWTLPNGTLVALLMVRPGAGQPHGIAVVGMKVPSVENAEEYLKAHGLTTTWRTHGPHHIVTDPAETWGGMFAFIHDV